MTKVRESNDVRASNHCLDDVCNNIDVAYSRGLSVMEYTFPKKIKGIDSFDQRVVIAYVTSAITPVYWASFSYTYTTIVIAFHRGPPNKLWKRYVNDSDHTANMICNIGMVIITFLITFYFLPSTTK